MLRALFAAAFVWFLITPFAHACPTTFHMRSIVFESIPENASPHALVLRVAFPPWEQSERSLQSVNVAEATVLEVLRGEYDQPTVPVVLGFGTCDRPPFGLEGLIIGRLGAALDGNGQPELVFYPQSESIGDRFERLREVSE